MIDEQRYRALIQQLASGGIAGNKTYHQVRDQYMPMDSESMGYMNGGGIGSMMQPRRNFKLGGGEFEEDQTIGLQNIINSGLPGNENIQVADAYNTPTEGAYGFNLIELDKLKNAGYDPAELSTYPNQEDVQSIIRNLEPTANKSTSMLDSIINSGMNTMSDVGNSIFSPAAASEIDINDLTNRNNGNFLISAANALPNQTGKINSATNIMSPGVRTMEGSLIDGDDPSSRYAVQKDFDSLPPSYNDPRIVSEELGITGYGKPNIRDVAGENLPSGIMSGYTQPSADYPDMIRNPENFPNRLQNLERFQDNRFSDLEFQEGFNFKDAPNEVSNLSELYQNRNFMDNPRTGFFDKNIMSKGNPDASLVNKIKQGSNGIMDFISKIPTPLNLVRNIMNPDPNAPSYKTYSPNIDYSKLNTTNLNDFYDSNPESETYGTTRFDRAKKGSFGSFRTLADYFNRNKSIVDTGKKAAADKKAQDAIKAAEARQAVLDARQAAADRSRQSYNPGNIGGGSYRSDRDNSRDGGYGGSSKRSADNRSSDLGFSDIRLKDNIELVGKSPSDINIYNFTYLNDPKVYQGVMAQEVPWASVKHDSGYLMVDYNKVDVDFKSV
jgi:hypothetical protein